MIIDKIQHLISNGQQFFTDEDISSSKIEKRSAVLARLRRLREKKRIFTPTKGFHVIVPDTYMAFGTIPAEQYIDQMMDFLEIKYYVGVLSASAIHGASHQKPMVFQVCVDKRLPDVKIDSHHVQFIQNKDVKWVPIIKHKTKTGFVTVSNAEATCYDQIKFLNYAGGINNAATNLRELLEDKDPNPNFLANSHYKINILQRIGHVLQAVGLSKHAEALHHNLSKYELSWTPLIRSKSTKESKKDKKWMVLVNEEIEADV